MGRGGKDLSLSPELPPELLNTRFQFQRTVRWTAGFCAPKGREGPLPLPSALRGPLPPSPSGGGGGDGQGAAAAAGA